MSGTALALSGGIGGAKLALGLSRILPGADLKVAANTGDDFRHLGLAISPDIDTLLYTLSGLADTTRGWGRRDETWTFMAALKALGGPSWFQLGDGDLAMHVDRSHRLAAGQTLSSITADAARQLGIACSILPMSDDPVATKVETETGWLDFQDYFVGRQCKPAVRQLAFEGAATARPLPELLSALQDPSLRAVVICPSNPYLSIDPMLAIPAIRAALSACPAPIVAVSPIIGGQAVKGPTAKIMRELGLTASAAAAAAHYQGLADAFLLDAMDADTPMPDGMLGIVAPILMVSLEDRERLAQIVLDVADSLPRPRTLPRSRPRARQ